MIGIILAAGYGRRLNEDIDLERIGPKCLLTFNGHTLLERMVSDLVSFNVQKINIVLGYKAEFVRELCGTLEKKYEVNLNLLTNVNYLSTNTAYSLNIGLENEEDVVIFNGDMLYDYDILRDLMRINQTAISVDNTKILNEESFKLWIINNQIEAIGKNVPIEKATGEFIGISQILKKDILEAKRLLNSLISEDFNNYYDLIYQHLSQDGNIAYSFTKGMKWTEIDDIIDFRYAESIATMCDATRDQLRWYRKLEL